MKGALKAAKPPEIRQESARFRVNRSEIAIERTWLEQTQPKVGGFSAAC